MEQWSEENYRCGSVMTLNACTVYYSVLKFCCVPVNCKHVFYYEIIDAVDGKLLFRDGIRANIWNTGQWLFGRTFPVDFFRFVSAPSLISSI